MLLRLYPVAYVHDWYMTSTVDILCGRGGTRLGTLYCLRGVSRIEVAISALQIVKFFVSSKRVVHLSAGLLSEHVLSHNRSGVDTLGGLSHYLDALICIAEQ